MGRRPMVLSCRLMGACVTSRNRQGEVIMSVGGSLRCGINRQGEAVLSFGCDVITHHGTYNRL
jgi:hypothetical protein